MKIKKQSIKQELPLFELKPVDRDYYAEKISDILPDRVIDIHTHVWLDKFKAREPLMSRRTVTWPDLVAKDNCIDDLMEAYRLMLPGKEVCPAIFGNTLSAKDDIDGNNAYVSQCAAEHNIPAFIFSAPQWSPEELDRKMTEGGFAGVKSYLSLADASLAQDDICIFDFFPKAQLEILDRRGAIVMLHIPRSGRIRDPVNLDQMQEIENLFPRVNLIIAHVGRAYCPEDIGGAFEILARTKLMKFDFSANTNEQVFRRLLDAVGPERVLFGSDMPITRMRMRRVCESGNYVNIVPKGLYGDISSDIHMRETAGAEAEKLSFFLYEEIYAFLRACKATGLTKKDIENVFCNNARKMLKSAGWTGSF